jgi:hypothetical protein
MRKSLVVSLAASAMLAVVGCQNMNKDNDHEMAMSMNDAPMAARNAFNRDHPGTTPTAVKKEVEKDGSVRYEFKFKDANGKKQEAEYDMNGMAMKED